jgi:hypothetical protein
VTDTALAEQSGDVLAERACANQQNGPPRHRFWRPQAAASFQEHMGLSQDAERLVDLTSWQTFSDARFAYRLQMVDPIQPSEHRSQPRLGEDQSRLTIHTDLDLTTGALEHWDLRSQFRVTNLPWSC